MRLPSLVFARAPFEVQGSGLQPSVYARGCGRFGPALGPPQGRLGLPSPVYPSLLLNNLNLDYPPPSPWRDRPASPFFSVRGTPFHFLTGLVYEDTRSCEWSEQFCVWSGEGGVSLGSATTRARPG